MTVNTTWTSPSSSPPDLSTGDVISETAWDYILSNLNFLGGASGVYGCHVYHDANQSLTTATETTVAYNQELFDTDTMHDPASNNSRITFTTAGKYFVGANMSFDGHATGYRYVNLRTGGSAIVGSITAISAGAGQGTNMNICIYISVTAAAYIECRAYQNSGGALNVVTGTQYSPEFYAFKHG